MSNIDLARHAEAEVLGIMEMGICNANTFFPLLAVLLMAFVKNIAEGIA